MGRVWFFRTRSFLPGIPLSVLSPSASLSKLRLLAVLSVSQLIGWGTTFDMPSVLGRAMERDLGLPFETIFGGLTAMMIVMALASPRAGRLLVALGAARVMAMGSVMMASGLTVLSLSQGPVSYFAAWAIIGLGGTCALSVAANTAVVEREGAAAKRTIGTLMIFTGLSSTLFWPILSFAEGAIGWRATLQMAAAAHLVLLVPLHLYGLPARGDAATLTASTDAAARPLPIVNARDRLRAFLLIASASSLNSLTSFGVSASLIELLKLAGAAPALALTLASLRGVIGISARLADLIAGDKTSPVASGLAASAAMFGSFLLLAAFPASRFAVPLIFVLLYGAGSGVAAVARALLPLAFFTREEFATLSSNVALPQNIASALSPVIFAAMMENFGLSGVIALALTLTFLTCLSMAGLMLLRARADVAVAT